MFLSYPLMSLAAGLVPCGSTSEDPCTLCHFFVLFKNIIDLVVTKIVPSLAVLMIVIGGFMYIFAYVSPTDLAIGGGDSKGGSGLLSQAKKLISSVIIGLIIVYGAWIIINTFFTLIGVASWTGLNGGWFKIECTTVK